MQMKRNITILLAAILMLSLGVVAAWAQGQGGSRGSCASKAQQTLDNLDSTILDYERQMASAPPVEKGKYEEWIRELKKLRSLVADAKAKLENKQECASNDCVQDQCSLVDITEQQVTQLIKETEERLGNQDRFGSQTGREVSVDSDSLGDDGILGSPDPNDASDDSYADDSEKSDSQTGGTTGENPVGDDATTELPPTDPADTASPS